MSTYSVHIVILLTFRMSEQTKQHTLVAIWLGFVDFKGEILCYQV